MPATHSVPLETISTHLDALLRLREIPDEPNAVNGLQVANRGAIHRIVAAVDVSQRTIDAAAAGPGGPALILVHHGLLWDGNIPVTERRYRRLQVLFRHDLALYSAHIPLDVHPELGNNAALAGLLGLEVAGGFGQYRGISIGIWGTLDLPRADLVERLDQGIGARSKLIPGGPNRSSRVGIITGGAGSMIGEAVRAGLDTYITGEGAHHTYFDAIEGGINVIYAGHYATEKLGVQRLAEHLSARFGLPWEFYDHDTGL